eukprot:Tbor_TRINITY_DN4486_c0_g1::TRINITY_DN4486_c0_g1_i2::g.7929::m.7929
MTCIAHIMVCSSVVIIALLLTTSDATETKYGDSEANKFSSRKLMDAERDITAELFGTDTRSINGTCDYGVHLIWQNQLGSSILSTPLIVDLFSDGKKDVMVTTATHYVEALDGLTGHDVGRFPFMHPKIKSQSSPLAVDLFGNGMTQYMISNYNGELVFIDEEGVPIQGKTIKLPSANIMKDWHLLKNIVKPLQSESTMHHMEKVAKDALALAIRQPQPVPILSVENKSFVIPQKSVKIGRKLLMQHNDDDEYYRVEKDKVYNDDDLDDDGDLYDQYYDIMRDHRPTEIGTNGMLSPEAQSSMDIIFHPDLYESQLNVKPENDIFTPRNKVPDSPDDGHVLVDAHILATPLVADMDGDGGAEAIVSVSYFFDESDYAKNDRELPVSDPENYVASGIVCISLITGAVKWSHILHVTTKHTAYPAYALSTPLFVNIDSDMRLDVFITTSQGIILGFNSNGVMLKGFPVSMGPILGSPIAVDADGNGAVDICAADVKGNIACFNKNGQEVFDTQVTGSISATPIAGDVNRDGLMDIVVGTTAGHVYAITLGGSVLPNFPFTTGGPVLATPTIIGLTNTAEGKNNPNTKQTLQIIVPSSDGYLYIISTNGCAETIDLGEKSFSSVLADDMTGNGNLDLVVTTLSGTVSVFETATPFHPLKQWLSKPHSINAMTAMEGNMGVYIEKEYRMSRDIQGDHFTLRFTIYDERPGLFKTFIPRYAVYVLIGRRLIVYSMQTFHAGSHTVTIPAPLQRVYTSVSVIVATPNAMRFEDSISLSFNMHFLDGVKFVFIIPFLLWCVALANVKKKHTVTMHDMDPKMYRRYNSAA